MRREAWMHGLSAALVLGALGLWAATGREGFTRWPDARLEAADAAPSAPEAELLRESGFETGATPRADIHSRFALGLVPGGADVKHLASVALAVGVGAVVSGIQLVSSWRARRRVVGAEGGCR